jgi:hypothetical protein
MARSRRESHHRNRITDQKSLQQTSATKSATSCREQMQQKLHRRIWRISTSKRLASVDESLGL